MPDRVLNEVAQRVCHRAGVTMHADGLLGRFEA
jgi:hypothetical protein